MSIMNQVTFLTSAAITTILLVVLFYLFTVFFIIINIFFFKLSNPLLKSIKTRLLFISKSSLLIIHLFYVLNNLFIFKAAFFVSGQVMCGHLLISTTTYRIFVLMFILTQLLIRLAIKELDLTAVEAFEFINSASLISSCISILWLSNSYFSVLFSLDCMNLIIVSLVFDKVGLNSVHFYVKVSGVASFFWASFISTVLLLTGGLFIIDNCFTTNLTSSLLIMQFILTNGITWDLITLQLIIVLLFSGLLIKLGLFPFFIWKKSLFSALSFKSLYIYMFIYFSNAMLIIVSILINFIIISGPLLKTFIIILMLLTILSLKNSMSFGTRISDFFVYSTLLNGILMLCVILGFLNTMI